MNPSKTQDAIFEISRSIRESGEEVLPMAFVLSGDNVIQMPLHIPKNLWRPAILALIEKTQASAVILTVEAWAVLGKKIGEAVASKLAGLESLEDFPGRVEVLQCQMECSDGSHRTLRANLSPEGKLGNTQVETDTRCEGELVGFFKQTPPSSGQVAIA